MPGFKRETGKQGDCKKNGVFQQPLISKNPDTSREKTEIKVPFVEIDFTDDKTHTSRTKEAVLYAVRIQQLFDRLGSIEISPEMIEFIREPNIREKLGEVADSKIKIDLSSSELPFLMRAQIVDAYFQQKISEHLEQLDVIDVFIPAGLRRIIEKPIGYELKKQLQDDDQEEEVLTELPPKETYDAAFEGVCYPNIEIDNALVPQTKGELSADHLGGKDAIDSALYAYALATNRQISEAEQARYNDYLRIIFQQEGKLPPLKEYNFLEYPVEQYKKLPPVLKLMIHHYLMDNIKDAQKIRRAALIFPGEIPKGVGDYCMLKGLLKANTGVKLEESGYSQRYYFDNDSQQDLSYVALGAQNLIDLFTEFAKTSALEAFGSEMEDFRGKRQDMNLNLFGMLSAFEPYYRGPEPDAIKSETWHELFELKDANQKTAFYHSYLRLFGSQGFKGNGGRWNQGINIQLEEDGTIRAREGMSYLGWNDMDYDNPMEGDEISDWFNPIERSSGKDTPEVYFRKDIFEPNIENLREMLTEEVERNERVKQAALSTGDQKARIEEQLFLHIMTFGGTYNELADPYEKVVVLLPFIQNDLSQHMKMLGITDLNNKEQVGKAYRAAIMEGKVHPDLVTDPQEKINKAEQLGELTRARDELNRAIKLRNRNEEGVSIYIGNVSQLLKFE
jgi:hypothetical protein